MATSVINNVQPCGLKHLEKLLLIANDVGDTIYLSQVWRI